jgi:RNA polymerase sigma-70 factor (sigma-E family)
VEFEQFVQDRQHSLFRFAVVLCGDPSLAEDLVQNVLGRAFERWHRVAAAQDANAYVRRMVVNEYLDWRRLRQRSTPVAEFFENQVPSQADPTDQHDDAAVLVAELGRLPRKQRAALVLRYYAGMSYAEVAAHLGCRESTARTHTTRALATLRIELAPRRVPARLPDKEL